MTTLQPLPTRARAITTQELRDRLTDLQTTVVDIRPLAAYNGWRLGDEVRGGHVPGAKAFPASWLEHFEDHDLQRLVGPAGAFEHRTIVVYGDRDQDAAPVVDRLFERGHRDVLAYEEGWQAWAADPALPVERLPRFDRLVHTGWLNALLEGGRPEAAPSGRFLLFHVNFGVPEEYADGHLPGALFLDTNWLEDPADWNRRGPAELDRALTGLGLDRTTTVILYGRDTEGAADEKWPGRRAGQIAATRAALILRYAGVDDVRLLDGGYDRWVQDGYPIETIDRTPTPIDAFGATVPVRPELIVDLAEAKEILEDVEGAALVSVRTWREHVGAVSGYNYIGPAGRIAGDVWGNCGSDAYHMQHYRTVENTMRPYPEIADNWAEAEITPDKRVAFYCGTGWRASETWFYAYLMAWPRIAVYDGGWFEWSQDPLNNPIEVGEPRDEFAA
ncbi:MAG TPA: rhodanese-like domain-containing protein [Candidatus Limnocylindrales bacterium]|jgi:thiosulfate/3-mercaptopyruvate sulfurtransferase